MSKICAYCENTGKMTREHIWPQCIIKRTPNLKHRLLGSKKKVIAGELIITDVCAECNNKKLSVLDAYICSLYDQYFMNFVDEQPKITFEYNYELFLRSLLKISYNSLRTTTKENNYLSKYKDFILNGGDAPSNLTILAELIPPSLHNGKKIYPHSVRAGEIKIDKISEWVKIRVISLNSFYFYLVISELALEKIPPEELNILLHWGMKSKISNSDTSSVISINKNQNTFEVHKDLENFIH